MSNKKRIVVIVALIILFVAVASLAGYFMLTGDDKDETEAEYIAKPLNVEQNKDVETEEYPNDIDFNELKKVNEDIYAWIRVPGTNIDYAILCNEEDGYYLKRNQEGAPDNAGAIFTDKYNSKKMTDPVTVIYGHNLASVNMDTMFTMLHKYGEQEFFEKNSYIYIYLPGETLKYQIFSAVSFGDKYILSAYDFTKAEDFTRYITKLNSGMTGIVDKTIQPEYGNPVITLSTCYDEFPNQRWLVNGVLIERTSIK